MRILDENGVEVLAPDLDLGYLVDEELKVAYHDAHPATEGSGHYETIAVYENGGTDVKWVWDVEPAEEAAAYWETETIQRYIAYSPDEIATMKLNRAKLEAQIEITSALLTAQINSLDVDDGTAYRWRFFYPVWESGKEYAVGTKLQHDGALYKVCSLHTSAETWLPGSTGSESLYTRIDETHAGTSEDPIPYLGNMALESGKYYSQDGVTYLCNRDTGIAVHNALADLVGLYVEVA